jgi:hypothetical protein
MNDYRIQVTDPTTGHSVIKGFDRAKEARKAVEEINQEKLPNFSAKYIGRRDSKLSRELNR